MSGSGPRPEAPNSEHDLTLGRTQEAKERLRTRVGGNRGKRTRHDHGIAYSLDGSVVREDLQPQG